MFYHDIKDTYPELYREVFKEEPDIRQIPSYVYLYFEADECVAMITAYPHNTDTVYMQMGGVKSEYRGYKTLNIYRNLINLIHEDFDNIICMVQNIHVSALKLMLAAGMTIIGMRLDGEVLFIEFMRTKGG